MSYVFKKKFSILELTNAPKVAKTVVIAEPEDCLKDLYSLHLTNSGVNVVHSQSKHALEDELSRVSPQLLMISTQFMENIWDLLSILKKVKSKFPGLHVVTISLSTPGEQLRELMKAGVSSHIERKLTRVSDVVTIVTGILSY